MGPNKMQMNANHYHYADIVSCARGKKKQLILQLGPITELNR